MAAIDTRKTGAPSSAEVDFYLHRGQKLRSEAMAQAAASLGRGVVRLLRHGHGLLATLPQNRLWRVPGTGNCLNC